MSVKRDRPRHSASWPDSVPMAPTSSEAQGQGQFRHDVSQRPALLHVFAKDWSKLATVTWQLLKNAPASILGGDFHTPAAKFDLIWAHKLVNTGENMATILATVGQIG